MAALFDHYAAQTRDYHVWGGVAGLALGAGLIPGGILLLPDNATAGAIALGAGIGSALGGTLLLVFPRLGIGGEFRSLADLVEHERAAGKPPKQVVATVESEWGRWAQGMRSGRHATGIFAIALGGAAVAGGIVLAATDVSTASFSRKEQEGFSAALLGFGAISTFLGLQSYLFESPCEAGYSSYEAAERARSAPPGPLAVSVVPFERGAVMEFAMRF
jgi:hypothetical protein